MPESPAVAASGTQAAVIGTEHDLYDSAAPGAGCFEVDPVNMASGDVLELRVYKMVLTGGTRRVWVLARLFDAQPTDSMINTSIPFFTALSDSGAIRCTLKQTAGTGRAFPWCVTSF